MPKAHERSHTAGGRATSLALACCWSISLAALAVSLGCQVAPLHREQADARARRLLDAAQKAALGERADRGPLSVSRPSDTLRRRLLAAYELPIAGPASLGASALPRDAPAAKHWPDDPYLAATPADPQELTPPAQGPLTLTLEGALQVAARDSREYQDAKEAVFLAALQLDLERNEFRTTFTALAENLYQADLTSETALFDDTQVLSLTDSLILGASQRFLTGGELAGRIGIDLVKLLSQDRASSVGLFGDASISIPLLRGAGAHVVGEPMEQAKRDVIYAFWRLERVKRTLAVDVATDYLSVLRQLDTLENAADNYRRLIVSTDRAVKLAQAQRVSEVEVDQSRQSELSSRDRWVREQQSLDDLLDRFKQRLGLPVDAPLQLDRRELDRLQGLASLVRELPKPRLLAGATATRPAGAPPQDSQPTSQPGDLSGGASGISGYVDPNQIELVPPTDDGAGPLELASPVAIREALARRLDLREAEGAVEDAQRQVAVLANALLPELTLLGTVEVGERRSADSAREPRELRLRLYKGLYTAGVNLDFGLERTAEQVAYREGLVRLEQALRAVEALEDQVKSQVRDSLRTLVVARESMAIQAQALVLAERRVRSAQLFLEAGRAQIRDLLEAQNALISAQNGVTAARVSYRLAELALQRDLDVLEVSDNGLWREWTPPAELVGP